MNNTSVDAYLQDGCGRCERYQTPQCKVHRWTDALVALRALLLETELVEEMKWGSPCYTLDGKNVVMITSFLDFCALAFWKGVLLADPNSVLEAPGPNSRVIRQFRFTSAARVEANEEAVRGFLKQAIELERSGAKVETGGIPEPMPDELLVVLDGDPEVRAAYDALTPGRQRSYILHVSGSKNEATRAGRAERCVTKILAGKGFNER